jgi:hypothetical protein
LWAAVMKVVFRVRLQPSDSRPLLHDRRMVRSAQADPGSRRDRPAWDTNE